MPANFLFSVPIAKPFSNPNRAIAVSFARMGMYLARQYN
jgi:hypothetical protein